MDDSVPLEPRVRRPIELSPTLSSVIASLGSASVIASIQDSAPQHVFAKLRSRLHQQIPRGSFVNSSALRGGKRKQK